MKVSGIDEDLIEIIDYMNENGLKPWASCDGVLAHHTKHECLADAQVSILETDYTIPLLANAYDNGFEIGIESFKKPYEIYGNVISGRSFDIMYKNKYGENSEKFNQLVKGTVEKNMIPSEEAISFVSDLLEIFPNEANDMRISILIKDRSAKFVSDTRENTITIFFSNKSTEKRVNSLDVCKYINEKYGIKMYNTNENTDNLCVENNYLVYREGSKQGFFIFDNSEIELAKKIIKDLFEYKF